jgi:hypothetical protein
MLVKGSYDFGARIDLGGETGEHRMKCYHAADAVRLGKAVSYG